MKYFYTYREVTKTEHRAPPTPASSDVNILRKRPTMFKRKKLTLRSVPSLNPDTDLILISLAFHRSLLFQDLTRIPRDVYVILASSSLQQPSSLSLSFMTSILLKGTSQVVGRMTPKLVLLTHSHG